MPLKLSLNSRLIRSFATLVGAIGLTVCVDGPTAPRPGEAIRASFNLVPVFPSGTRSTFDAAEAAGVPLNGARIEIMRGTTALLDTSIVIHSGDSVTLQLSVDARSGEVLTAGLEFKSDTTVLYKATAQVTAVPVNATPVATPPTPMNVLFVGPGSTATEVLVSPPTGAFGTGAIIPFTAIVLDSVKKPIENAVLDWTVNDATLGAINVRGEFTPSGKRGTAVITASTRGTPPVQGTATISLTPPATKVVVLSGSGQTAAGGQPVSAPLVVAVQAADNLGVPGVTVTFAATDGGSVNPTTAVTDADGKAQAILTVGNQAKTYNYSITAGSFSTTATAVATIGTATKIAAVGPTSFTLVSGQLPTTASHVLVTDAGNNPVPNTPVTVEVFSGTTSIGSSIIQSDATGRVLLPPSVSLTAQAGVYTVRVSAAGLTGSPINFTVTIVAGTATKLVVKTAPSAIVKNETFFDVQPQIQLADVNNNVVSQAGVAVTAAISAGGGTLNGSASATTDAAGVASFSNLSISGTAGARTLSFASTGLTGTSATVTLIGGSAVTMVAFAGDQQSATVGTALATVPAVKIVDGSGNPVEGVSVRFAITGGGGQVSNAVAVTDASGVASSGGWTLGGAAGTQTLRATAFDPNGTGVIVIGSTNGTIQINDIAGNPLTFTATGTAAAPARLVITRQPTSSVQSRAIFPVQPQVRLVDAFNNPVSTAGIAITAAVQSGGTADGQLTAMTDATGVATFTNLSIAGVSGVKTLAFTSPGLTSVTTNITVTSGAAISMLLNAGDGQTATVASVVPTVPSVKVVDRDGNPVAGVNILFAVKGGGGNVTGAAAVTNTAGIAAPTQWRLGTTAGENIVTAIAYDPNGSPVIVVGGIDGTITIDEIEGNPVTFRAFGTSSTASAIAFSAALPAAIRNRLPFASAPVIQVVDAFGNPVAQAGVAVTASASGAGAALDGTLTVATDAQGRATFNNLSVAGGGSITFTFTSAAPTATLSQTRFVTGGLPASIAAVTGDGQAVTAGANVPVPPTVRVVDADGFGVQGVPVVYAMVAGGGTITLPNTRTDANGVSAVGSWTIPTVGEHILRATAMDSSSGTIGVVGSTTGTVSVATFSGNPVTFRATGLARAGAAIVAFSPAAQTGVAGQPVTQPPAVRITDNAGAPVPNITVTFAVTGGEGSISSTSVLTNSNGVAQLGSWTLGRIGATNTVVARAINPSTNGVGITGRTDGTIDYEHLQGNPVTFTADVDAATLTWVGGDPANPSEWNLASNWSPAQIPGVQDTAIVGASSFPPIANGLAVNVGSLRIAAGATVVSFVPMAVNTPVTGMGTLILNSGLSLVGGTFDVLSIGGSGSVNMTYPTTANVLSIGGTVTQANGTFNLNAGHSLHVTTLATSNRGSIRTFNPTDSIFVHDASFDGKQTDFLLQGGGTFIVTGDFLATSDSSFRAVGTNAVKVVFAGSTDQTVLMARRNVLRNVDVSSTAPTNSSGAAGVTFHSLSDSLFVIGGNLRLLSGQITVDGDPNSSGNSIGTLVDVVNNLTLQSGTVLRLDGRMRYGTYTNNGAVITGLTTPYPRSGPAPASQLAIATQPGGAVSDQAFSTQPVIQIRNPSGAVVTTATNAVTATVFSGTGVLIGTTTVNAVNGVATFSNLGISGTGAHVITFAAVGLASANSNSITVTSPPGIRLLVNPVSLATVTAGQNITIPMVLDMSGASGQNVAALTFGLDFDTNRFTFVSGAPGTYGSVTSNTTSANTTGHINVSVFDAQGATTTQTVYSITLQAKPTGSITTSPVSATVSTSADESGAPVTVTPRSLSVRINP